MLLNSSFYFNGAQYWAVPIIDSWKLLALTMFETNQGKLVNIIAKKNMKPFRPRSIHVPSYWKQNGKWIFTCLGAA